jgi:hypothetical protein
MVLYTDAEDGMVGVPCTRRPYVHGSCNAKRIREYVLSIVAFRKSGLCFRRVHLFAINSGLKREFVK